MSVVPNHEKLNTNALFLLVRLYFNWNLLISDSVTHTHTYTPECKHNDTIDNIMSRKRSHSFVSPSLLALLSLQKY